MWSEPYKTQGHYKKEHLARTPNLCIFFASVLNDSLSKALFVAVAECRWAKLFH